MVLTGLRRSELCGLMYDDVEKDVVHIRRSINKEGEKTQGKTQAARRYMVLSSHALRVLDGQAEMLKTRGIIHSEYILPDQTAQRTDPAHLYKAWCAYRKQNGIMCSLHEMRHTLVSVSRAEIPEQMLKPVLGHTKNMDTFGLYGHEVDGDRK
ncbi:MAG: tyrosine-type recombinase/integrase [Bacillota bacterium]|jgi:integrase